MSIPAIFIKERNWKEEPEFPDLNITNELDIFQDTAAFLMVLLVLYFVWKEKNTSKWDSLVETEYLFSKRSVIMWMKSIVGSNFCVDILASGIVHYSTWCFIIYIRLKLGGHTKCVGWARRSWATIKQLPIVCLLSENILFILIIILVELIDHCNLSKTF